MPTVLQPSVAVIEMTMAYMLGDTLWVHSHSQFELLLVMRWGEEGYVYGLRPGGRLAGFTKFGSEARQAVCEDAGGQYKIETYFIILATHSVRALVVLTDAFPVQLVGWQVETGRGGRVMVV